MKDFASHFAHVWHEIASEPVEEGFAFLGFEFRKPPRRLLYMWPRKKACQHIRDRVREVVRFVSQ